MDIRIDVSHSTIVDIWDKLGISEVDIKWQLPLFEQHDRILNEALHTKITNYLCLELGLDPNEVTRIEIDADERPKIRYTVIRRKDYHGKCN